ncbi:TP73 (predicted) [Pycnogonum litorale]
MTMKYPGKKRIFRKRRNFDPRNLRNVLQTVLREQNQRHSSQSPDVSHPSNTNSVNWPPAQEEVTPRSGILIPPNNPWYGMYRFKLFVDERNDNSSYVYSDFLKKLFTDEETHCPVSFCTVGQVPSDCIIKATLRYSLPQDSGMVVSRCIRHSDVSHPSNNGVSSDVIPHVLQCQSPCAHYVVDPKTEEMSVIAPYTNPPAGTNFNTYLYKFACLSSCAGGINRRSTQIVFSLIWCDQEIGRQILEVKICKCPKRDSGKEENSRNQKMAKQIARDENSKLKRKDENVDVNQTYTIQLQNKEHYKILMSVKKALEKSLLTTIDSVHKRKRIKTDSDSDESKCMKVESDTS